MCVCLRIGTSLAQFHTQSWDKPIQIHSTSLRKHGWPIVSQAGRSLVHVFALFAQLQPSDPRRMWRSRQGWTSQRDTSKWAQRTSHHRQDWFYPDTSKHHETSLIISIYPLLNTTAYNCIWQDSHWEHCPSDRSGFGMCCSVLHMAVGQLQLHDILTMASWWFMMVHDGSWWCQLPALLWTPMWSHPVWQCIEVHPFCHAASLSRQAKAKAAKAAKVRIKTAIE